MAWNRPKESERGIGNREQGARKSPLRGLISGAVVVLGAAVAAWWLWPNGENAGETLSSRKEGLIKAVTPTPAPKVAEVPRVPTEEEKRLEKIKFYEDSYRGKEMPPAIKAVVYYLKHPTKKSFKIRTPYSYLRHPCERQIAGLMDVEPGTYFVINPNYGEEFDDDFTAAFVDGTIVDKDDADDVRVVKENVAAVMKDLARICREEGKKPSQVMEEYASSLYSLGQFQRNLEEELQKIYDAPELSNDEVKDFCTAANKMLEEKGIAPLPYPDLTERSIELQYNQHALEKEE